MNAHGRRYSQKIREAALKEWEGGKTPKEIAKEMGIGLQTLYRWYHRKMAESGHNESGRIVKSGDRPQAIGKPSQVTSHPRHAGTFGRLQVMAEKPKQQQKPF